ncbi:hypothetical protein Sjap_025494 [Stephania japonica]|uniref:Disease resistance protein n=1 Tax=Stephania japonica TaxID=461633 RepID=A0AAP0E4Z0_9MAGN
MKEVENADHVGMHDLVRDLAIQIMRKDLNFISKAGMDLSRKWPEEAFAKARKISMVDAHLEAFPNIPSCNPNLSTLLLGHSEIHYQKRVTIPMSFFSKMLALQVLDISYIVTDMKELPESLSELVGLRALFLVCLSLKKIPSLAKLKELQMLSFRNSTIDEAPAGMEALVNLRLLNLEETEGFKDFNPDLISKLSLLQQLNMLSCDILSKSSRIAASCIEGIASLKCLTNLSMSFDDLGNYLMALKLIQWNKLKGFYIHVWPNGWWTNPPTTCRGNYNKKFVSINAFSPTKFSDIQIPSNSQELWLQVVYRTLEDLEWKEDTTKDEVHLLPGNGLDPRTLASLENLTLKYFNFEFDVFCRESLQKDCLTSLKNLIIDGFWLKNLSSFNTLQQLKNLEVFKVLSCVLMEEIIKEEVPSDGSTEVTSEIVLPKLHTLIFGLLPKLHCISSNMTWICDSLKVVAVFDCPELEQFPLIQFPTSGIIYGTSEWWERLQWENPMTKDILQSHFRVANATDAELCPLLGSNYSFC